MQTAPPGVPNFRRVTAPPGSVPPGRVGGVYGVTRRPLDPQTSPDLSAKRPVRPRASPPRTPPVALWQSSDEPRRALPADTALPNRCRGRSGRFRFGRPQRETAEDDAHSPPSACMQIARPVRTVTDTALGKVFDGPLSAYIARLFRDRGFPGVFEKLIFGLRPGRASCIRGRTLACASRSCGVSVLTTDSAPSVPVTSSGAADAGQSSIAG
jgi:hypothetical protein